MEPGSFSMLLLDALQQISLAHQRWRLARVRCSHFLMPVSVMTAAREKRVQMKWSQFAASFRTQMSRGILGALDYTDIVQTS